MSSALLSTIAASLLSDADVKRGFDRRRQELAVRGTREEDGFEATRSAAPQASQSVSAEPLPERRRDLDQALGRRLDQLRRRMRP